MVLILTSLATAFVLTREQMASDLEESAQSIAQAFRDRIIDGDIRSVEPQIRLVLRLSENESAQILKSDFSRVYSAFIPGADVRPCPNVGKTCFDGYAGQARIVFPIFMSTDDPKPLRYLYISKSMHLNWVYLVTVFLVFTLGYVGLAFAFLRVSKVASVQLSQEIERWSTRLKADPKDVGPMAQPPFAEMAPLKSAIQGLYGQIQRFEKSASDKARLLVLRGIAHDLLTPVARLQLYLATLERGIDVDLHAEVLSDIKESLQKVTSVASQVKSLKEIDRSTQPIDLVVSALEEIEALRVSESIASRNIGLEFHPSERSVQTSWSQTEVSRILSNLVQNAAEASPDGSVVRVEVGTANGIPFLSVQDHGIGIHDSLRERIFDADFTLKPATGTGLGLSIVRHICDQRSATIEVDSLLERGTKITIRIPAIDGEPNV